MHRLALAVATFTALSAAPVTAQTTFDPTPYLGQGDAYNCADFVSQADAQAVLRADPTGLDADRDGITCESNKLPKDMMPAPRA